MNERFENIDQFFKDELENFSPEVPSMAWENISQSLSTKKSKKLRGFYYKIIDQFMGQSATASVR